MNLSPQQGTLSGRVRSTVPYVLYAVSLVSAALIAYELFISQEHQLIAYIAGLTATVTTFASAVYQHRRDIEADRQNAEIMRLQEELNRSMTGGDSFAAMYFGWINGKSMLIIRHFGVYPLTTIRINIVTPQLKHLDAFVYPTLPPDAVEPIKPFPLDTDDRLALQINFSTLTNSWYETLLCAKVQGELVFAIRVWKLRFVEGFAEKVMLHEEVNPRFPRDSSGEVDWSFGGATIDTSNSQLVVESEEQRLRKLLGTA